MNEVNEKKSKSKLISFFQRIKTVKGIEWVVVGVACCLVLLIYFSTSFSTSSEDTTNVTITSSSTYAAELEAKLSKVLSNMNGAGTVSVMITLESGAEIVVATSKEERTNSSTGSSNNTQSVTIVETPIIIGDEPLVLMEILPIIKGVIVVAQGAGNIQVRLELLRAVQALLEIDSNNIEIFVGK